MVRIPISTASDILPANPTLQRYLSLLECCSSAKHLFQIHARIILSGFHRNADITHKIIHGSTSISPRPKNSIELINYGRRILYSCNNLGPISWNNVIRAYSISDSGSRREALWVFLDMRRLGIAPNEHTFPYIFKACASFLGLKEGGCVHGDVIKHGLAFNVYVQNTLIHFYGECKKIKDAYKVFDEMPHRTVVSWNSIIAATVECSWLYDSVELFVTMRDSGFEPDETTMVIALSACSELGNLSLGKLFHSQVIEKGMSVNCQLGTALVDMYGKCGDVNYARLVFNRMVHRNVWTWSAMILGYAQHGLPRYTLELFNKMRDFLIKPNHVTFLGVLSACSHAGLVEDGKNYFNEMEQVHGVKPTMPHFGAMVDILGRAGHLKEAYDFIMKMPVEADAVIWRALLSACNAHDVNDYTGLGEKVRQKLIELEPKRSGNIVMLANNYAKVGLWEKAEQLRRRMKDKGLKKKAGESCLELPKSDGYLIMSVCSCSDDVVNQFLLCCLDSEYRWTIKSRNFISQSSNQARI